MAQTFPDKRPESLNIAGESDGARLPPSRSPRLRPPCRSRRRIFQKIAGVRQPRRQQPFSGGRAGRRRETPQKCPLAHSGRLRQASHGIVAVDLIAHSVEKRPEPGAFVRRRDGAFDELRLSAIAMRRDDETPRNHIGGLHAEIPADQVQAQVYAGCASRRSQHIAFVDIEHVRRNIYIGITRLETIGVAPVRCGAPPRRANRRRRERKRLSRSTECGRRWRAPCARPGSEHREPVRPRCASRA